MFCSHVSSIFGRHALYHQIKVMTSGRGVFCGVCIFQKQQFEQINEQLESIWKNLESLQGRTLDKRTNPKTQKHITANHVGGRAVTGNAMAVKIWLLVLVTHILALWWCTVPPFLVRSQHACSPPSFTATAVPHAVPTNTKEHCCLLRNQVLWMILANSFISHSRWPVFPGSQGKETVRIWLHGVGMGQSLPLSKFH